MLMEVDQREQDGDGEECAEREAGDAAGTDRVDGRITGCGVDEGAVWEQIGRGVGVEGEVAG